MLNCEPDHLIVVRFYFIITLLTRKSFKTL
ncbi:hypothetical protein VPHK460_0129 [Vibrio phage K460]